MPNEFPSWYGVDLDGTLAFHTDGEFDPLAIGDPIPRMRARVMQWLAEGKTVKIFTARVAISSPDKLDESVAIRKAIQDWTEKHFGVRLSVTCVKDPGMLELWDDKAVRVLKNTGVPTAPVPVKVVNPKG